MQILTVKLKLNHSKSQKRQLDDFCDAYRNALNFTSNLAFVNEKTSNKIKIHELSYYQIREKFGISSQLACSIARDVGSKYKQQWTKLKQHQENIKKRWTKKKYKGLDKPVKFTSRTANYQYNKDYSFKKNNEVSILTLNGRLKLKYSGWNKHLEYLQTCEIGAANLWYDKVKKHYYLCVSVEVSTKEQRLDKVVGCDLGQRYLATTQSTDNEVKFYSGGLAKHKANQFALKRKELQKKGTRSAKRKLVSISKRERRFKQNVNHVLSKQIVKENTLIGLEELKSIRTRTKRRKGKKASKKQRTANANYSKWAFAELGNYLTYKSNLIGGAVLKIDADYTSQMCPSCGHTSKENRLNKGLDFVCQICGFQTHADRVGAMNILMRTILARQDLVSKGSLSACLNVNGDETKAVRLKVYSELRWNQITNQLF